MRTRGLQEEMANANKEFRKGFELRTLGTRINIQTTKTLVQTELEVEARAERGSRGRTGTDVGVAQPPKFGGSIMGRVPTAAHLIAALN
jgi:hypothetical protein